MLWHWSPALHLHLHYQFITLISQSHSACMKRRHTHIISLLVWRARILRQTRQTISPLHSPLLSSLYIKSYHKVSPSPLSLSSLSNSVYPTHTCYWQKNTRRCTQCMPAFCTRCNWIISGRQASFSLLLPDPLELSQKTAEHGSDHSELESEGARGGLLRLTQQSSSLRSRRISI